MTVAPRFCVRSGKHKFVTVVVTRGIVMKLTAGVLLLLLMMMMMIVRMLVKMG